MKFSDFSLCEQLLSAVEEAGYTDPTPIQLATIPIVLQGADLLGTAQTGSGKTAAFALPILQLLAGRTAKTSLTGVCPIRALVLTPTRELAVQIDQSFQTYGAALALSSCAVFGGVSQNSQMTRLRRGADILIATPGRLIDLISQKIVRLDRIEIFVLDEADRMLDMGFIRDVKRIITKLPKTRQTLFFSATMPLEVEQLAIGILHNPQTVKVDPVTATVDSIRQMVCFVDKINKRKLLAWLLKKEEITSVLVFTKTKITADRVTRDLISDGVGAMAIHGDKNQKDRQNAMNRMKEGRISVLVATDIAARGIDIADLSHVINYDLPEESEIYIHRIGRTGRAGHIGNAISFCCYDDMEYLRSIEKLINKTLEEIESPWPIQVFTSSQSQPKYRPRPTKRTSYHSR